MARKNSKHWLTGTPDCHILRMPVEILCEIFILYHSLLDFSSVDQGEIPSDNTLAREILVLGSVCRIFRAAAWCTPRLWTYIVFAVHPSEENKGTDSVERFTAEVRGLEAWLQRTGTEHALHVYVKCVPVPSGAQADALAVVVDMLVRHCHRWREVGLYLPRACLVRMNQLLALSSMGMPFTHREVPTPLLRKLMLFGQWQDYYHSDVTGQGVIDAFVEAPLEELQLSKFPQETLVVVWGQLTRFEGYQNSLEDVLDVLRQTPILVECSLSCTINDNWGAQIEPVCLPRLRSLTLSRTIIPIDHLILPALETLVLHMDETEGDGEGFDPEDELEGTIYSDDFVGLVRRSGCTLQRLHLHVSFLAISTFLECLRATPQLKELVIEYAQGGTSMNEYFLDRMVHGLTPRTQSPTVVPELIYLEVRQCSSEFSIHALGEMLWLRWGAGQGERGSLEVFRLQIWMIEGSQSKCEDVLKEERIRTVIDEGMLVDVNYA
ncbi:hypothetical protein H0H81_004846 [Sphagnurus paluster]|uniref:F-box domain-containing protein n=1 Tax=Sphagnurus paluster TaxID=117069 RepID=A0A9P7GNG1_9AGAR|nr:hypothetical protein H0H81_004846 [Sphagnurus paluster]